MRTGQIELGNWFSRCKGNQALQGGTPHTPLNRIALWTRGIILRSTPGHFRTIMARLVLTSLPSDYQQCRCSNITVIDLIQAKECNLTSWQSYSCNCNTLGSVPAAAVLQILLKQFLKWCRCKFLPSEQNLLIHNLLKIEKLEHFAIFVQSHFNLL